MALSTINVTIPDLRAPIKYKCAAVGTQKDRFTRMSRKIHKFPAVVNSSYLNGSPFVKCLGASIGPPAIFRRIWSIWIDAIDTKVRRTLTHIFRKIKEIVSPAITHFNSSASIIGIRGVSGIVATPFYAGPYCINTVVTAAVTISQLIINAGAFLHAFATSFGRSAAESFTVYRLDMTTITTTEPMNPSRGIPKREGYDRPMVKSFICYINELTHILNLTPSMFLGSPSMS